VADVRIYADGSSLGNPGRGGWAYIILADDDSPRGEVGSDPEATSNVMELTAAFMAMSAVPDGTAGTLFTDSQYVVKGMTEWRKGWQARGMRKADNKPVANAEYWLALFELADARPGIAFRWVKGHAGNTYNEFVDEQARRAATEQSPCHPIP
jgi:ribonuclease HI